MQVQSECKPVTADIFCRVVDNFGDIGVCWRLARRLAHGRGWSVRLWVDDLASFSVLAPAITPDLPAQTIDGITVRQWDDQSDEPALQVVIEAFACDPPARFIASMRQATCPPVWVNLEYLSAERWVEGFHRAGSLRADGLRKNFFFPGFTSKTGGLLREPGLIAARDQARTVAGRASTLHSLGLRQLATRLTGSADRCVSLFCYPYAPLAEMFSALSASAPAQARLSVCVPHNVAPQAENLARSHDIEIVRVPFFSQADYDRLLWCMDLNVVRGEDSFVRAIWAGRPMLWHIYPQQELAHMDKLDAWLALSGLPARVQQTQRLFNQSQQHAGQELLAEALVDCFRPDVWESWREAADAHCAGLASMSDLADNLADFCIGQLHSR